MRLFMGELTTGVMKIFDCITFFRELELLDLRLMELYDVVDHFVIVEATRTHQGCPHDPVFLAHRQRFLPYLDKIIHVLVDDLPIYEHEDKYVKSRTGYVPYADWRPEHFSRNAIERGLVGLAQPGDRVLVYQLQGQLVVSSAEVVVDDILHSESTMDVVVLDLRLRAHHQAVVAHPILQHLRLQRVVPRRQPLGIPGAHVVGKSHEHHTRDAIGCKKGQVDQIQKYRSILYGERF